MRIARVFVGLCVFGLAACSDDDNLTLSPAAPPGWTLSDGTQVEVSATGGVQLRVNGRAIFATSDTSGPAGHRFEDT